MRKIILASASAQRMEYFELIFGNNFKVSVSDFCEDNNLNIPPKELCVHHALGKARDVSKRFKSGIVVGADTFVYLGNKVIGKPKDELEAFRILKMQSGKILEVYSGIAVIDIDSHKEFTDNEVSKVFFAKISDDEIKQYVGTGEWKGKAGGWANLGKAGMFIEKVEGCMANVAGLPLNKLYAILKKIRLNVFEY